MIWSDLIGNYKQHFECGERLTNSLEHFLERLPGAIQAAARAAQAMGLSANGTTPELFKLMKDGKLISEDFLPYFSEELMKAAMNGGALEQSMKSTAASIGRFQTAVWNANRTFNQSGFDKTVGDLFDTLSFSINQANPVWQLFGKISEIVGRALRAPIELLGTLSAMLDGVLIDKMGNFTDTAKKLGAALLVVSRKARIIAIAFWLIPAAISAINDTIENGMGGWDDWVIKLGIAAATIAALAGPLSKLVRLLRGVARAAGRAGGAMDDAFGGDKSKGGKAGKGGGKLKGKAALGGAASLGVLGAITSTYEDVKAFAAAKGWSDAGYDPNSNVGRAYDIAYPSMGPQAMTLQERAGAKQAIVNGDINFNISGDPSLIKPEVLKTVQDLFDTTASSNPVTEQ